MKATSAILVLVAIVVTVLQLPAQREADGDMGAPGWAPWAGEEQERPTQADMEQALQLFGEIAPGRIEQMNRIKEVNPEEYREMLEMLAYESFWLLELSLEQPVEYMRVTRFMKCYDALDTLTARYHRAVDDVQRAQIRKDMIEAARGVLDLEKEDAQRELADLENYLQMVKKRIETMENDPEAYLAGKVSEILEGGMHDEPVFDEPLFDDAVIGNER